MINRTAIKSIMELIIISDNCSFYTAEINKCNKSRIYHKIFIGVHHTQYCPYYIIKPKLRIERTRDT